MKKRGDKYMINSNLIKNPFETVVDIEKMLYEAEKEINDPNTKFITHEELFESARRLVNGR